VVREANASPGTGLPIVPQPGVFFDRVVGLPGLLGIALQRLSARNVSIQYQALALIHAALAHRSALIPTILENRGLEAVGDLADDPAASNP